MTKAVRTELKNALGLLRLAPVLSILVAVAIPAGAADRVVLCEEFTATSCGYCPYAGQALDRMLNNWNGATPLGTFTLVQYHIGDSYSTTFGNSRSTFYAVAGTPTAWFDGLLKCEGAYTNVEQQYSWYLGKYNQRRATATDVTISVTGVQVSGPTFTIRARVAVEAGGTTKPLRLYMAQVLDRWPNPPTYSRYGFKQAATMQDVTLSAGQSYLLTRTFTFDSTSWANQGNIKIVVWAQAPASASPATVYQAAVMNWPFAGDCDGNGIPDALEPDCNHNGVPDDCDIASGTPDCNGNGIPDSCDIASGDSQDANGNGIPDECETLVGDMNCDGVVNFGDINPFVLALTGQAPFEAAFPNCHWISADVNGDGTVDFGDINPFVALLTGS